MIRKVVVLVLVAAVLVVGLRFVDALASVQLNTVRVAGELTSAESDQVRAAVTEELAKAGWRSAADVADAVQALGWVREVRVRREWPDVLHVRVAHETVAAYWGDGACLTADGSVVPAPADPNDPRLGDLPVFRTSVSDGPRTMRIFDLLNGVAQTAGLRIVRLNESAAGDWTTTLANGLQVVLGATDLHSRFERFARVYEAALRDAPVSAERVDARYHTGVAVRWTTPATETAPARPATLRLAALPRQHNVRIASE